MFILIFLITMFSAHASIMDLNEFMPTRMEDASVTPIKEIDFQASARYEDASEATTFRPNIRYGLVKRVHLEVANDMIRGPKTAEKNSGQTIAGFQWHFNDQDDWVPAFAFEPQFTFPTGKNMDGIDPSARLNMTYTLAGTLTEPVGQFHLNYKWEHNSSRQKDENKVGKLLIFGYSQRLGTTSALIGNFNHEKEVFSGKTINEFELGWTKECFKDTFLGLGAGIDIQDGYFSSTLAIQKTF